MKKDKEKNRQIKHTILIYCEGKTDHLFVRHLKNLYFQRYSNKQVTLKKGTGGGWKTFISDIVKLSQIYDYNEKYILLDSNSKTNEDKNKAEQESFKKNIKLIWQEPCLEGVFLQILTGNQPFKQKNSASCKYDFNTKYLESDSATLKNSQVERLFPKEVLEKKRTNLSQLNQLIQLMK